MTGGQLLDRPPAEACVCPCGLSWLLEGVHVVLEEIATTVRPAAGRVLPLVVLPVVGIGAGGFDDRGAVIRGLLDVADDVVRRHAVDIAFVTPDPAVQHLRRKRGDWRWTSRCTRRRAPWPGWRVAGSSRCSSAPG
jgi:hypothetical protein